ncbi:MAG: hypothetical protein COX07_02140, partial [Bacteroidetes bacterium CG23_combo_of_CG06-09_8_20_14_all_32_9]
PGLLLAQQNSFLLTQNEKFYVDAYTASTDSFFHTTFKPLVKSTISGYSEIDKRIFRDGSDSIFIAKKKHTWFWKKLLTEDLIEVEQGKFHLSINPVLNFEYGKDSTNRFAVNSRGLIILGDLSDKFSFTTGVLETQAFPEKYISNYLTAKSVVPGQGRIRIFKKTGYDYSYSFGNISYSPSKHFNFQLGHGKQFVGDGYRSLLLSDVPFYYPYFRTTTTFKRIQYVNLWTAFQEVRPYDNRTLVYQRKHGSFTFLNFLISKKTQIGLFEAVIFQTTDSATNNKVPVDILNPVIGYRTLQYGLRYKHNTLVGITAKVDIEEQLSLYGQFVLDDIKRNNEPGNFHNRFGYQAGLKMLEPFNIHNLFLLTEYNTVRPFTYSATSEHQNYSAYNEPLAHPLGANFKELIFLCKYNFKDAFIQLKFVSAFFGNESIPGQVVPYDTTGHNIFQSYSGTISENSFKTGNGISTNVKNLNIECGITINQKNRLQLVAGAHYRTYSNTPNTSYYYVALKTSISNLYYDF